MDVKQSQRVKHQVLINSKLIAGPSCGRPVTPEVTIVRYMQSQGLSCGLRPATTLPRCTPKATALLPQVTHLGNCSDVYTRCLTVIVPLCKDVLFMGNQAIRGLTIQTL
jgi:hypothetical protein